MNLKKSILIIALLVVSSFILLAQTTPVGLLNMDDLDSLSNKQRRFSPTIFAGIDILPKRNFVSKKGEIKDDSTIQYQQISLAVTAPIKRWIKETGSHQLNVFGSMQANKLNISWLNAATLFNANAGLQYLYYQPHLNLLMFHYTIGFANDETYFNANDIDTRKSWLLLYNRLKGKKFQYFIGLAGVNSNFNGRLTVPFVGAKIKIKGKDFMRISFPLNRNIEYYPSRIAYYHPVNHQLNLYWLLENTARSYRIYTANQQFYTNSASSILREGGRTLGMGLRYAKKKNIRFQLEVNYYYRNNQTVVIAERRASIADATSRNKIESGFLFSGSVAYNFLSAKQTAQPSVNYFDIQNIDIEDLPDDYLVP